MATPVSGEIAAVLDTLDAASMALTLCDVGGDVELQGPRVDGLAALLVTSGTMHLQIGERHIAAPAGHVALIPSPEPMLISGRRARCSVRLDSRACLERRGRWLVADATAGGRRRASAAMVRIAGGRGVAVGEAITLPLTDSTNGARLFALLKAQLGLPDPGAPALALSLVSACIIQACRTHYDADAAAAPTSGSGSLARALTAVRERPGDDHRAESLARLAGMSRSTFVRQVARLVGVTPREYVQQIRLEEAATLLRTSSAPVKAIAADLGFQSRSHFSRAFRNQFGADPSAYRAQGLR